MGMGCRPMGLPMLRPLFVMYKYVYKDVRIVGGLVQV
jgi:hypothetical protein